MRWITVVGGMALALVVTAGCKQQCFLHECDADHYQTLIPSWVEHKPVSIQPGGPVHLPDPTTVESPERPIRYISLAECIALALENGNTGEGSPNSLITLQGVRFPGSGSENIRVISLNPALSAAAVEISLTKFDAVWNTSISWNNVDRPVGTPLDTFQTGQTNVQAIEQQEATFVTNLAKPLPTGGVAGITFTTDYQLTNLPARVNPSYRPALQFQFEQPLLQNFGVEINQLLPGHPNRFLSGPSLPGTLLNPTNEGILVTRLRFDQDRTEFERRVQLMLLNVESAYWTLYGSYWTLFAQEQALRIAYEGWKLAYAQQQAGRVSDIPLAAARTQYEQFRSQRLAALGSGGGGGGVQPLNVSQSPGVLEAERQLRNLLNFPVEDGTRLVPSDAPTLAPYRPNWNVSINEALALRPELILARQELKIRQFNLLLQKNNLRYDLRAFGTYDINGIGTRLDGPGADNALRSLASNHFNNWQTGLSLVVPIGYRAAYINVRRSKLELAQSYWHLQAEELKTQRALAVPYRLLYELHDQIEILRAQREGAARELRANLELVQAGRATAEVLLGPTQKWANALSAEYNFIVQYNIQLAGFEFAKGTILQHNNVHIAEGALPYCAQVRAVEHERQRTLGLVLAHRKNPVFTPECSTGSCAPLPQLPYDGAAAVPSWMESAPKVPSLPPEKLKMPRPTGPNGAKQDALPPMPGARVTTGTVTLDPLPTTPANGTSAGIPPR